MNLPKFTEEDAERAFYEWGSNCGPGALAAILGLTLDEVRPLIPGFAEKHYTNPTMMFEALRLSGKAWRKGTTKWPCYGLVRVQWDGPWMADGVPMAARYRYTHWIGAQSSERGMGIFDINCMNNGTGWVALEDWDKIVVPHLTANIKRATGLWSITHSIEVTP